MAGESLASNKLAATRHELILSSIRTKLWLNTSKPEEHFRLKRSFQVFMWR